jgi:hypothetical protein
VDVLVDGCWQLESPGKEYVVYLFDSSAARIDLSASRGKLAYRWYNPLKGTFHESWWVSGREVRDFVCPWNGDAVLHVWKPLLF